MCHRRINFRHKPLALQSCHSSYFKVNVIYRMYFELRENFVMYISATAALYSKMFSFGMTSVIWSFKIFVNTNCSALLQPLM